MAEIPDVAGGEVITAAHMNRVAGRTIQVYVDEAARDASILSPAIGDYALLLAQGGLNGVVTLYNGAGWVYLSPPAKDSGAASGTLQAFPAAQEIQTLIVPVAGVWELTACLYFDVSSVLDTNFTVNIQTTTAGLVGQTACTHHGTSNVVGFIPVSLSCTSSLTAAELVRLEVLRNENNGTQLFYQARILGRMVS